MRTLLFAWLFLMLVDAVSGQCLSHQQSLLLKLKDTLIFNASSSGILARWNRSSDCCTWKGVTCEEGRVTGLILSNESITGGIDNPSSLFQLQYLKSLDLSSNNINSKIPSRIRKLQSLSFLNFSNAGFVGHIPKGISLLTKLVTLDLSSLFYTGSLKLENPNLEKLIQNLTELEELYLDGVNISAPGKEWGQALSSSLPNLRVLSLVQCDLFGPIDQSLAKLHSLSVIRLDDNKLSAPVPGFFAKFSNLTSLSLKNCWLNGMFPKEIFQVPTLQTLDLSYNILLEGSFPEFSQDNPLQILLFANTNFSGNLPTSIGSLRNLSLLDLSSCQFNGTLPNSMQKLAKLVYLDLSNNNFTGPIPSFNMSKNLTQINLSSNGLAGPISSVHWEGLLNLEIVDFGINFLNGDIPSTLFALPSIRSIQLRFNQFSGQVVEFPNAAFSLLESVDLRSNHLHGPIPMSIFELRELRTLLLSSNKFNGTIQFDMIFGGRHSNLKSLDLSYNNLTVNASGNNSNFSTLPKFSLLELASCKLKNFPNLKDQPELQELDLSDNEINGDVPSWIWKVGNGSLVSLNLSHNLLTGIQEPYSIGFLSILDLHFNQLRGKIPILTSGAGYIDLSRNYFTSSIPADIGKYLSSTVHFSLSENNLTGVVPKSICNATALQFLDLSHNGLTGRIPACILAMSQNFGVNLRSNHLSGKIPDAFPVDCQLDTLDLNGNLLTGRIPKSLSRCTRLGFIDLGNNQMLDTFPLLLKNISTLRILVLRSNKFYGNITCKDNIGTWPMIQIFDVAFNNFSGELPGQCLTKWQAMMAVQEQTHPWTDPRVSDIILLVIYSKYYPSVTNKGLEMELVKIPNGFTVIDFSSNNFHGEIPEEVGQLKILLVLNLSNNALSGQIPSSFGNLLQLESLDLSRNHVNGTIPESLSKLTFLQVLNLSYNELAGRIPKGNQLQTFSAESFLGNEGLCGPPLTSNCTDGVAGKSPETPNESHSNSGLEIEWNVITFEIGFIVGFGSVIGPLVFWSRWRKYYFDRVEDIAYNILPQKLLRKWLSWKMGSEN